MVSRKLNIEIIADDKASSTIDQLADDVESVEGDHRVGVDADTSDAGPKIEAVRTDLEEVAGREWVAKLKSDIEVDREHLKELSDSLDEVADADGKIDPKNLRDVDGLLSKLPGSAGEAGREIGDAFTSAGSVVGVAAAGVGVAMAAWKLHQDRARQHAEDMLAIMREFSSVADEDLAQAFAELFVKGAIAGKDTNEIMEEFVDNNLVGARRAFDLAEKIGLSADQTKALRDAIYEEERATATAADTQRRYGDNMFYAADAAAELAAGIERVNDAASRMPQVGAVGRVIGSGPTSDPATAFAGFARRGSAPTSSSTTNIYVAPPSGPQFVKADMRDYERRNGSDR